MTYDDLFVRSKDLFVISNPTSGTRINSHLPLPINRALGLGGEDFWLSTHLAVLTLFHLPVTQHVFVFEFWEGPKTQPLNALPRRSVYLLGSRQLLFGFWDGPELSFGKVQKPNSAFL